MCHATGRVHWDLPKGELNRNESPIDACIRETKEETDYDIPSDAVIEYCGQHPYLKDKECHIFKVTVKKLPPLSSLQCLSMVRLANQPEFPEVDEYKYVKYDDLINYATPKMFACLTAAGIIK